MRLFEAIVEANHRAAAGDNSAGLHPADFADSLPLIALTCIDPRLNPLLPEVLGIPEAQFIWMRNAGNIITGPLSSTMRSLALACAIKGGHEIVVIGHTDCQVRKTSILELTERLRGLGLDRAQLPENLAEFFGVFASERQNVIKGAEIIRSSPLLGPKIPVHGLLLDIQTGRVDWLVNGYETLASPSVSLQSLSGKAAEFLTELPAFQLGEMKFPEGKIGDAAAKLGAAAEWVGETAQQVGQVARQVGQSAEQVREHLSGAPGAAIGQSASSAPPKSPVPPPLAKRLPGRPIPVPVPRIVRQPKDKR